VLLRSGKTQIVKWTTEGAVKGIPDSEYSATLGHTSVAGDMLVSCKACGLFYFPQSKVAPRVSVIELVLDSISVEGGFFVAHLTTFALQMSGRCHTEIPSIFD